ncbi:MAG: DNA polymerase IV [Lachnospiraceae bacterium]|nr:DNA polymerase IV [Lachnospiraceae bacterium]
MERLIFHVDVNSAFLSWEAARRVRLGEPDLRLIPSCVGGNPEKRTSIVTAKSIPAKSYGINTGEPISMALKKCPNLVVVQSDFRLYQECSNAFKDICRKYAPVVEEFSIDECFLDMTGTGKVYPDPIKTAYDIKNEIRDTLGFTVNVGIGANKLLAKMASDFEKPDKVHTLLNQEEVETKMWPLPIGDLFGVGKASTKRLIDAGIKTIGELAKADISFVKLLIGDKSGEHIYALANGTDESPVTSEEREAKSYSVVTTVEENITSYEVANQILLGLADSVCTRMRKEGARAYCVSVKIRSDDFKNQSHQLNFSEATDVTEEIYETSKKLFADLWDGKTPLRLMGIALSNISKDEEEQLSLFVDEEKEKQKKVDAAMDSIRSKYGMSKIMRGSVMKSSMKVGRKFDT